MAQYQEGQVFEAPGKPPLVYRGGKFVPMQSAPQQSAMGGAPAFIDGPPKQPDAYQVQRDQRQEMREDRRDQRADSQFGASQGNLRFDNISKLRTEFNGRKEYSDYSVTLPQVADAMKMARNPNASGADDLSLIYTFGKVMDPGSVVREGELALASGTGSFAQNLEGAISKLKSGQKLPPEVRMNLVRAMQRRGVELARNYNRVRDQYKSMAERYGFNPEDVVGIHPGGDFQQIEADFLGAPIKNRDGSMGAMPSAPDKADVFTPGGAGGQPPPQTGSDPAQPNGGAGGPYTAGPDGFVRGDFNPNLTPEVRRAVHARAEQMIREGAAYDQVAELLLKNGLMFQERELRAATEMGRGKFVSPDGTGATEAARGLVKGALHPIDRAAEGLESGVNAVFGTDFDSASQSNRERDAYFATHPFDAGAETVGNVASSTASTWRLGPMLGGAAGNILAGDSSDVAGVVTDGVIGAAGGKAADLTVKGVAGAIAPKIRPEVRRLADEGVDNLTPGQFGARRGALRRVEERATSLPGKGGGAIEEARDQTVIAFNRAAANRALKNIGKAVPKTVEPGNQTVQFVEEQLSGEYQDILSRARVNLDMGWARRVAAVRQRANLPAAQQTQFDEIVGREITAAFGRSKTGMAAANGQAYKKFDEKLGDVAAGYARSDDPYIRALGDAIADVRDQTAAQLRRQNPALAKRLKAVDLGWAQYARIRQAAAQTTDGIFTPKQLQTAVRVKDRSASKGAVAKGTALMQDLAQDGSAVLPSTVGNSGTADRAMTLDPRAWALSMATSGAYQPGPINALNAFLTAPRGPAAEATANVLRKLPAAPLGGIGVNALLSPASR